MARKKGGKNVSASAGITSAKFEDDFSGAYEVDDMPKKFKRLVAPPVKKVKPLVPMASKKEPSEWDVRPGESFKQFNERLGISGPKSDKPKNQQPSGEVGSGKNFKSRLAAEFAEARGLRTKRKEHLKQRDQKKKGKKPAFDVEDVEEIIMDRHKFGETVMAPPVIRVKPKAKPIKR